MSSSRDVGLYFTLLLALLCNASEGAPQSAQSEVTVMHVYGGGYQKEMPVPPEVLDLLIMQRPIIPDLSKLMVAASSDVTQREVTNFHPEHVQNGLPVFGPRSIGPRNGPNVDFPPSFPNKGNLRDICQFSKAPTRYQKEKFPRSGFGMEHRQADAVNQLQSWYSVCCDINLTQEEQICCAEQAWKKSLSAYCTKEFSIKTSHYFCCKESKKARWSCFEKEASESSYHVSSEVSNVKTPQKVRGFKYNSQACKGSLVASPRPRAPRKQPKVPDFNFPPGRPNSSNIEQICTHRKIRPRYLTKCLPCTGYDWLVRQSKAINVLEREYNQCCEEKKGEQSCAEKKWKKMVDKLCKDEKKTKGPKFECCGEKKGEEQYACFASAAPDPGYNSTDPDLSASAPPNLQDLCDTHSTIKSMKGFPFSVDKMVERCCPLVLQEKPACIEAELDSHLNDLCKAKELVKPHCCEPTIKHRAECATKLLLHYIDKANKDKISGRKKCPLIVQFQMCRSRLRP
ncbi:extracellular matrix protein 1 [Pseudorasbora parva]|uniref:extracellular matrix protein 1 n=1 Tax=Pseudorasbora parva TaxID=51549 RepID=UPI00351F660E